MLILILANTYRGVHPPKPMMHITPYFKFFYKFPPISAKLIVSSYNCSSYGSRLIYVFASPYLIRESKNVINQSILNKRILIDYVFASPYLIRESKNVINQSILNKRILID